MSDNHNLELAKTVFDTLCSTLDENGWKFERDDEHLKIEFVVEGEDLPIEILVLVRAEQEAVTAVSYLPIKIPEDKAADIAFAVCHANYKLVNGRFDYSRSNGELRFLINQSYMDCVVGREALLFLVLAAVHMTEEYNDKFFMVAKGLLTLEQFVEWDGNRF